MGMVIVIGTAYFPPDPSPGWQKYDALPDPLGWLLVLWGVFALVRANKVFDSTRWLALVAAAVSVPMWFPQVNHQLDASGGWFVSLPQIAFCLVLSREIGLLAARQEPVDDYAAKRFGLLVWGFAPGRRTPGAGDRRRRQAARDTDRGDGHAGHPRVRVLPVPGAPARVARRAGAAGDPSATGPGEAGSREIDSGEAGSEKARRPPTLELRGAAFRG